MDGVSAFRTVFLIDYFEDENGNEISRGEMGPTLTGSPTAIVIPSGAEQHDIELILAVRKHVPVAEVSLELDDVRLLGYFCRDFSEMKESAFMKEKPGTITKTGGKVGLKTAVTDDEIRSFVTIFRRLNMEKEPANFEKAVAVFVKAMGNHPFGKWVAGVAGKYKSHLDNTPYCPPYIQAETCNFSTKRLIDVFVYTQYAHQPDEKRQGQFNDCLTQVHGQRSVLTWMFLTEIWKCAQDLRGAGDLISEWFHRYCDHHGVTPDILTSLRHDPSGLGAAEKEEARKARLFREKSEEIAMELWKQRDRPEGGPMQFLLMAREQLNRAISGENPD